MIKKALFLAIPLAFLAIASGSAHAYYPQTQMLDTYTYQPSYYNYQPTGFNQVYAQPQYYYPPMPTYTYDAVRPLIQGQLNFVSQFTFLPGPIHQYFWQYNPYYWGW